MAVKNKREVYKEKVNMNSTRSRLKYSNANRLKYVKTVKKNGSIKIIPNKPHIRNDRYKLHQEIKAGRQHENRIRTQTLIGNVSSNTKEAFRGDERNQTDTGVQAFLYASDKIDKAADIIYSSRRVIHVVKETKTISDTATRSIKGNSNIDRRVLIKQLAGKGTKSGLRTAKNINTNVSNQFQSEDTDLGIKSYAEAEKEVRRTYDTTIAVKNAVSDISNVSKKFKAEDNKKSQENEYFKNKIYNEKNMRYERYKGNVQRTEKPKSNQKVKTDIGKKNAYGTKKIKTGMSGKTLPSTASQKSTVAISKISKKAIETGKRAVFFILPGKKTTMLILAGTVLIFIALGYSSSGITSALSQRYFMADNDIAGKYQNKVEDLDKKLKKEIQELAEDDGYDDVKIIYIGDIQGINTNFQELFAAAAVEYEQDLTFSSKEESFVEKVHKKLYDIKITFETYQVMNDEGEEENRVRKIITVYTSDMETVMSQLRFDEEQKAWARRLVSGFGEQFPEFAQQYGEMFQADIQELMDNAPKMSSAKQKKLYDTALSLVGKVKYFWGGKSSAGWNSNWGEPTIVTAAGSDTTGKYQPFGLDCSGYVDWVYKTAGIGSMLSGGGTAYQFGKSYPVRDDELQIGDLAFLQMPNSSGINHVGIFIGKDKNGDNLYAHCEWGTGVTVNGFKGFKYFRRVVNFDKE